MTVIEGVKRRQGEGSLDTAVPIYLSNDEGLIVTPSSDDTEVAAGHYPDKTIINKFGKDFDVDSGSVPEDVWNGSTIYTGFPTGAPETLQAFSSSALDTGTLTISYLPSFTSTDWLTASVTLQGTTPVSFGVSGVRVHFAQYHSGTDTGFNAGEITVRHTTTTANVFCLIPIGTSQTNVTAYTIPAGHVGIIKRVFARLRGATTGQVDCALWVRDFGDSPRLRRPFNVSTNDGFDETIYGGLVVHGGADIVVRITSASANNLSVIAGYDLIQMKK